MSHSQPRNFVLTTPFFCVCMILVTAQEASSRRANVSRLQRAHLSEGCAIWKDLPELTDAALLWKTCVCQSFPPPHDGKERWQGQAAAPDPSEQQVDTRSLPPIPTSFFHLLSPSLALS